MSQFRSQSSTPTTILTRSFYYNDLFRQVEGLFYFDSELTVTPTSNNFADVEVTIKSA